MNPPVHLWYPANEHPPSPNIFARFSGIINKQLLREGARNILRWVVPKIWWGLIHFSQFLGGVDRFHPIWGESDPFSYWWEVGIFFIFVGKV